MNVRTLVPGACLLVACATTNAGTINTGQFQFPLDMWKIWGCDSRIGYTKDDPWGQPHLNHNGLGDETYHPGEDWNGWCGGASDFGDPIYSVADGVVYEVADPPDTKSLKYVIVTHRLPDATEIRTSYLHLSKTSVKIGDPVAKGQMAGLMGSTGTNSTGSHLHWEIHTDLNYTRHGYVPLLTIQTALEHTSPTLFVSDRISARIFGGVPGQWSYFQMAGNAPSSTAYVEYQGLRKSLQQAIHAGWIVNPGIYNWYGTGWGFSPISQVFFFNANWYAWMPLLEGVTLFVYPPLNTLDNQADRAKADMIREASKDPRFASVKAETYKGPLTGDYLWWSTSVNLHSMQFELSDGRTWTMFQQTSKQNPLSRLTIYLDLDTGQWGNWVNVDLNTLY